MRRPVVRFVLSMSLLVAATVASAQTGGQLRFSLKSEPKTLNPVLVADDASETVRYLTGGVLMRLNRLTQQIDGRWLSHFCSLGRKAWPPEWIRFRGLVGQRLRPRRRGATSLMTSLKWNSGS